jgi:glycosyltransferase involved in cell wall biosynthesis
MQDKLFSILICSLENRKHFLDRLLQIIKPQITNEVEVLISLDDGSLSIGKKRNDLLERSKGEYIAFVDDDDLVSEDYVELILKALESKPDVVGIHLHHLTDGVLTGLTYHSLDYDSWWEEKTLGSLTKYYRNPNHLNPVKKIYALQVKFPEISFGEDKEYSNNILPLLKTQNKISQEIYYYYFRTNK